MSFRHHILLPAILVLAGCAANKAGVDPGKPCTKPNFDRIIVNIGADRIDIPESKYAYLKEPMLNLTRDSLVDTLREEFDGQGRKVSIDTGRGCAQRAVLVTGQLTSLTHRAKRFSGDMTLTLTHCDSNKVLLSEEFSARNKDRDFPDTPTELGSNAGNAVAERLTACD
ncbi:MAG: hypothetical protein FDZ69_13920 [Deltaproteobacteria bacterium]|nr:MAG: hypothetical protein FDZ69_13920 [Deltaproteobacteria bacterium]